MRDLSETTVGDFVAYYQYSGVIPEKRPVVRTTLTRVFVSEHDGDYAGVPYTRRGKRVGGYSSPWIEPWDEQRHPQLVKDMTDELNRDRRRNWLNHFQWSKLAATESQAVVDLLATFGHTMKGES